MIDTSHPALVGLRLSARRRLADVVNHTIETGRLNRSDIVRIGEVSYPQASADLGAIQDRFPGLITYDKSSKAYVVQDREAAE